MSSLNILNFVKQSEFISRQSLTMQKEKSIIHWNIIILEKVIYLKNGGIHNYY